MDLAQKLREDVYLIKFYKKDGSEREMLCTLKPNLLPETSGSPRKLPDHLITVFDLDIGDWRTVNLNTLFHFQKVE